MKTKVTIDTAKFMNQMAAWAIASQKTMEEATVEMARRYTRMVIRNTPPSKAQKVQMTAEDGESKTVNLSSGVLTRWHEALDAHLDKNQAKHYAKLMEWRTSKRSAKGVKDIKKSSSVSRRARAIFLAGPTPKKAWKKKVILAKKKRIGRQAAGWIASAQALELKAPSWVTRHGRKEGSCVKVMKKGGAFIRLTNSVPYNYGQLQSRSDYILAQVNYGMRANVKAMKAKLIKAAKQ